MNGGDHSCFQNFTPVRLGEKCSDDITEERQRQPFEDPRNQRVRAEDLKRDNSHSDRYDEGECGNRHEQINGCGNRSDVGAGINCIGDHEQ